MAEPKWEGTPAGQPQLPFGQGRELKPNNWVDPIKKRLDEQVASGFERSAEQYGISVDQVRSVVDALGTESPRAFELIRGGMSPGEAIAKVNQGK